MCVASGRHWQSDRATQIAWSGVRLLEFAQMEVAEFDLARGAGVDLERDMAFLGDGAIGFLVIHRFHAVDGQDDLSILRVDSVGIPIRFFPRLLFGREFGLGENATTAGFIVESSPVVLANIRLIPNYFRRIGVAFRMELHAAVDTFSGDSEFEFEDKVGESAGR